MIKWLICLVWGHALPRHGSVFLRAGHVCKSVLYPYCSRCGKPLGDTLKKFYGEHSIK